MARADLVGGIDATGAWPGHGGERSFQRILVPVDAYGRCDRALSLATSLCLAGTGLLRIVHVRVFDPAVKGAGRFYAESSLDATLLLENAAARAWARGAKASGVVVEAQRRLVAQAISEAGRSWNADLIVLARRPRLTISRLILGSIADQVMRRATCPVVVIRPGQP
jgi:nucleotide-binding universal stress UspA family protein